MQMAGLALALRVIFDSQRTLETVGVQYSSAGIGRDWQIKQLKGRWLCHHFLGRAQKRSCYISYSHWMNEYGMEGGAEDWNISQGHSAYFFQTGLISPRSALLIWWWTIFHEGQLSMSLLERAGARSVSSPCPRLSFVPLFSLREGIRWRGGGRWGEGKRGR